MHHRSRRLVRLIALTLSMLFLFCEMALAASYSCTVNTDTRVYKRPSTSSPSLGAKEDMRVTMTAMKGSWARVTRSGVTAYIPLKYLTLNHRLSYYTTCDTGLYSRATSSSSKKMTLPKGTKVYADIRDGSYFHVENKSGSMGGYVRISHVSARRPSVSKPASKADKVLSTAKSLLGRPYAASPNEPHSFDCSGFTSYCFDRAGVHLSGSARTQGYNSRYPKIGSRSSLKKGDLVFFDTVAGDSDQCDHVGIYIGSGKFVHASSGAGKVIVSSLNSGFYREHFSWGRRVL